jgi:hypothetical protein
MLESGCRQLRSGAKADISTQKERITVFEVLLKFNQYFLYMRKWPRSFFGCLVKEKKKIEQFLPASLKTLENLMIVIKAAAEFLFELHW